MSDVGVVLLAAGRGTRFGAAPKLLAPCRGRPLAAWAMGAAAASRQRPVVVVLGAHAERVREALRAALDGASAGTGAGTGAGIGFVENPGYAAGLSTSLRAGLAALPDACGAAVVLLADMPRVTGRHVDALADAFRAAGGRPAAVVPVAQGRRGNPVLLNRRVLGEAIAALTGDHGAGPLLRGRVDVLEVAADAGTALDVDTAGDLARIEAARGPLDAP